MMWRRQACFQNDDKDCFDCKPFNEKVKTCSRGLVLRNDTIFCDNGIRLKSVLATECSQDSEGRCLDVARPPTPIPRSPLESLCRKFPKENICQWEVTRHKKDKDGKVIDKEEKKTWERPGSKTFMITRQSACLDLLYNKNLHLCVRVIIFSVSTLVFI